MPLSEANVIQVKMGSAEAIDPATVTLDTPTTGGGTLILEIWGLSSWAGMPDGWEYDGSTFGIIYQFRYPRVPAGESSWDFHNISNLATNWAWRITEWDTALDPVSPLDALPGTNSVVAAAVQPTFSTGTSGTNARDESVALATLMWYRPVSSPTRTVTWDNYTGGFTERGEQRVSFSITEISVAYAWKFNTSVGTYETTADITDSASTTNNNYYGIVSVYAATQPVVVPAPVTMVSG